MNAVRSGSLAARGQDLCVAALSDDWRMRYAADRRTIVEWRDPSIDPVHNRRLDNGFFTTFGEPERKLMESSPGEKKERIRKEEKKETKRKIDRVKPERKKNLPDKEELSI